MSSLFRLLERCDPNYDAKSTADSQIGSIKTPNIFILASAIPELRLLFLSMAKAVTSKQWLDYVPFSHNRLWDNYFQNAQMKMVFFFFTLHLGKNCWEQVLSHLKISINKSMQQKTYSTSTKWSVQQSTYTILIHLSHRIDKKCCSWSL